MSSNCRGVVIRDSVTDSEITEILAGLGISVNSVGSDREHSPGLRCRFVNFEDPKSPQGNKRRNLFVFESRSSSDFSHPEVPEGTRYVTMDLALYGNGSEERIIRALVKGLGGGFFVANDCDGDWEKLSETA